MDWCKIYINSFSSVLYHYNFCWYFIMIVTIYLHAKCLEDGSARYCTSCVRVASIWNLWLLFRRRISRHVWGVRDSFIIIGKHHSRMGCIFTLCVFGFGNITIWIFVCLYPLKKLKLLIMIIWHYCSCKYIHGVIK